MFNKLKKNMPTGIAAVGFIVFSLLTTLSNMALSGEFSYDSLIMSEYINEIALVVLFECLATAVAFKICLKKEKSADHDFQQK